MPRDPLGVILGRLGAIRGCPGAIFETTMKYLMFADSSRNLAYLISVDYHLPRPGHQFSTTVSRLCRVAFFRNFFFVLYIYKMLIVH